MARPPQNRRVRSDRQIVQDALEHFLNKPLTKAQRGDRERAYRALARQMGVSAATPRIWMSRVSHGKPINRHLRRRLQEMLGKRPPPLVTGDHNDPEDLGYLLGRIRRLHDVTHGRGGDWAIIERAVDLVEAMVRARGGLA